MNVAIVQEYNEYLQLVGGDKTAAASLALAAALRECQPATPAKTTDDDAPRALSVAEAAARLRLSRFTVYDLVSRGELGHHRVGRAIRILPSDIDTYQTTQAVQVNRTQAARSKRFGCLTLR